LSRPGIYQPLRFWPDASDQDNILRSNWYGWLGSAHTGHCAIWLEIDRERSRERFIGPTTLIQTKREQNICGIFFVGVEACHPGPIAIDAIVSALFIDRHDPSLFRRSDRAPDDLPEEMAAFSETLPVPPPPGLGDRLGRALIEH
jgi:hypothetical protein